MKKKYLFLSFLFICMVSLLAGCSVMGFKVTGVRNVSSPIIDPAHRNISFAVTNEKEDFDFDDILVEAQDVIVVVQGYMDSDLAIECEELVQLKEGLNTFYVQFSVNEKSVVWSLNINRLPIFKPIKDLKVTEFKREYYKNEEFVPGKLYVEYEEGSADEVAISLDMVSGFDTKKLGDKSVTIKYMDKSITEVIRVLPEEGSELTKLQIVKLPKDYYLNQAFQGGVLRCFYGKDRMDIEITPDMVTGFDTRYSGEHTAKITYGGITLDFEYNVSNISEEAKVYSFTSLYELNEAFKGGLIQLKRGNEVEYIEITLDMVTGFSTASLAKGKAVTVKYGNKIFYESITVVESLSTKPSVVESYISDYNAENLMRSFIALSKIDSYDFSDSDYEEARKTASFNSDERALCLDYLKKAGLNDTKVVSLDRFVKEDLSDIMRLFKRLEPGEENLRLLTWADIDNFKGIAARAINLLEISEYAMLIPTNIKETHDELSYLLYDKDVAKKVNLTCEKLLNRISDDGVKEFLSKQFTTNLSYKERAYFVAFMKDVLTTISTLDTEFIFNICQINYDSFIDSLPSYLNLAHSLGDNLAKIAGSTAGARMLNVALGEYAKAHKDYHNAGILEHDLMTMLSRKLPDYIMDVAQILSTVTEEELSALSTFIKGLDSEEALGFEDKKSFDAAAITLAKRLDKLANRISANGDSNLIDIMVYGTSAHNELGKSVIQLINNLKKYVPENMVANSINSVYDQIRKTFTLNQHDIAITGDSIIVKAGTSLAEFIRSFNKHHQINDADNEMVLDLTKSMLLDSKALEESLRAGGVYTTRISVNGVIVNLNYVVLDEGVTIKPLPSYNDTAVFYINPEGEILRLTRYSDGIEDLSLEDYLANLSLSFYVEDYGVKLRLSYDRLESEHSFSFNSLAEGMGIGALVIDNELGRFYLPNNYILVSKLEPTYDNGNLYYVKGSGNTELCVNLNYGYDRIVVTLNPEELEKLDCGEHTIEYDYNGQTIKLKITIVNSDEQDKIFAIKKIDGKAYMYSSNTYNNLRFTAETPNGNQYLGYKELENYIRKYHENRGESASVSFNINGNYNAEFGEFVVSVTVFSYNTYERTSYNLKCKVEMLSEMEYNRIEVIYDNRALNMEVNYDEFNQYKEKTDEELKSLLKERLDLLEVRIESNRYSYNPKTDGSFIDWLNKNVSFSYSITRENELINVKLVANDYYNSNKVLVSFYIVTEMKNRVEAYDYVLESKNPGNVIYATIEALGKNDIIADLLEKQLRMRISYKYTDSILDGWSLRSFLESRGYVIKTYNPDIYRGYLEAELVLEDETCIKLATKIFVIRDEVIDLDNYKFYYKNYPTFISDAINRGLFRLYGIDPKGIGRCQYVTVDTATEDRARAVVDYEIFGYRVKLGLNLYKTRESCENLVFAKRPNVRVSDMTNYDVKRALFATNSDGIVFDINLEYGLLDSYSITKTEEVLFFYDSNGTMKYKIEIK